MRPPHARTYGGLLREMAERFPTRPALCFRGRDVTFAAMDARVDEISRGLLALGVRRGDAVSVLAGNRPEWLEVMFGAARIGAVTVPLNTFYKAAELRHQLEHADVTVLFTVNRLRSHDYVRRLQDILPALSEPGTDRLRDPAMPMLRHVVQLESHTLPGAMAIDDLVRRGREHRGEGVREAERRVTPDDVALILFTSGSTALPKAVTLHHGHALTNDFNIGERQHLTPEDRLWLVTPLFYALAAVNAVPAAWTHGACLVLQETFDAGDALEIIERERATVYYGQPHITRALLGHPDLGARDISSLQKGVTGHTARDKRLAIEGLGIAGCCSMYGLTETYGHVVVSDAADPLEVKLHTQGKPLPDWELKVVVPGSDRLSPPGQPGELRVRGHVTSGYHKQGEATAQAFDHEGYFRTGDLVALDAQGRLRFSSRLKELIKVGGINVAPAEIEELLMGHPSIRQAHVVGLHDDRKGGEVVVAFVERTEPGLREDDVREYVHERAAHFKVPAHVLFRSEEQIPRGATGKVPKWVLVEEAEREVGGGHGHLD